MERESMHQNIITSLSSDGGGGGGGVSSSEIKEEEEARKTNKKDGEKERAEMHFSGPQTSAEK